MNPTLLKKGDTVALVATARKVSPEEVMPTVKMLESWGLHVRIPDGLFAAENQFAGSDAHRAGLLQYQLDDPDVKAVICARGGYGTVRILDRLDFTRFQVVPKWIVGFSDVTALHSHVACCCGVPTVHGIMPLNIDDEAAQTPSPAIDSLRQWLFCGKLEYCFTKPSLLQTVQNRVGECRSTVVGGNLSVLYSLLASRSDVDTEGKILLIEDLDEYLYHIDRMMVALKRSGKLAKLGGLLVGAMTDMHDNSVPFGHTAEEIVFDAVAEYGYPVAFGCPVGHITTRNRTIPLGVDTCVKVIDNEVEIEFSV